VFSRCKVLKFLSQEYASPLAPSLRFNYKSRGLFLLSFPSLELLYYFSILNRQQVGFRKEFVLLGVNFLHFNQVAAQVILPT
jgi:hypothetical protein